MPKRRASGEGGLYQRESDGRWVGALPAASSPNGKRRVVYGATRAEALAKLEALKAEARAGTLAAPNKITVAQLLQEYLRNIQVAGRARNTYTIYERMIRLYLVPRLDPELYPIESDEKFVLDLLRDQKILVSHGSAFNWPAPDHFRFVILPSVLDIEEAVRRISSFLAAYRNGTDE